MTKSALITVMTKAAYKAAKGLKRDFGELENLQVSKKGTADFVSAADFRSEKILFEELKHARPDFGFLMEEGGEKPGRNNSEFRWVIDPLDGTTNFLHSMPYFCISIGLEKRNPKGPGEIVAAVIYQPIADEMYWAEARQGAFLNDRRLRVSARQNLDECLLSTGTPRASKGEYTKAMAMMTAVTEHSIGIRSCGASALDLAYVAAGRYEGYWNRHNSPWDVAAGMLLVQEAGGTVAEIGGGRNMLETGCILATNGLIHKKVDALLNEFA